MRRFVVVFFTGATLSAESRKSKNMIRMTDSDDDD